MNCRTAASVMSSGSTASLHKISYTSSARGLGTASEGLGMLTAYIGGKPRVSNEERGVRPGVDGILSSFSCT